MEKSIPKSSILTGCLLTLSSVLLMFKHVLGSVVYVAYFIAAVGVVSALYHKETRRLALVALVIWAVALIALPPLLEFFFVRKH